MKKVGPYTLVRELGAGGMGHVHLARRDSPVEDAPTLVAIKQMASHLFGDPKQRTLFLREARIAGRIHHPNVVRTLEVIEEGDQIYQVMEYIDGLPLHQLEAAATDGIRVDVAVWLRIFVDVLRGIGAAYRSLDENGQPLHVIHRDISPHNILVGRDGFARVADFGVAKSTAHQTTQESGGFKGKVRYVAPEQITAALVSHATDIYSASVVAWELLAGTPLFQGETEAITITRVLMGKVPSLLENNPSLPASLDALIAGAITLEPAHRPQSADAFAEQIKQAAPLARRREVASVVEDALRRAAVAPAAPTATVSRVLPPPGPQPDAPQTDSDDHPTRVRAAAPPLAGGRRRRWIAAAIGVSILGAGGAFAFLRSDIHIAMSNRSGDVVSPPLITIDAGDAAWAATPSASVAPSALAATPSVSIAPSASLEPSHGEVPPSGSVKSRPLAPKPHKTKPDCRVPTYFDEQGVQRIRKECLKGL